MTEYLFWLLYLYEIYLFKTNKITKKDYLIKVFEKLEPHRSIMSDLLALLRSPKCTQDDIDGMYDILEKHIDEIQDKKWKIQAQKLIDFMKKLQEQEQISKEQDAKDIEKLIVLLEQM